MNYLKRCCWIIALLLASGVSTAYAQNRPVEKIEVLHVGPPAVSDELVRSNIRVKVGDVYDRTKIDDDIRTLYSTGYFYNIRFTEKDDANGVVLTYVVQGKPTLTQIRFEGNKKYSNSKLQKKITSKTGEPLDESKLFTDALAIKEMYQKAGFQKTEVRYLPPVITEATGRGSVTFEIKEAPKVKIKEVDFIGAQAFSQKKLRKQIKTRRRWFFSWLTGSGVLKDDQFAEDKERLKEFYQNEGYIDFELKDVKFVDVAKNRMRIELTLFEGKPYKVGSVEFKGNSLLTTNQLSDTLKMGAGKTFTPRGLYKDHDKLGDAYGTKGYIDANIRTIKNPNTDTGTMDLQYDIEEGDKSYIEKVEIKGNTITKDKVIRRELSVAPGEVFDMVRVKNSTNVLGQIGYFSKVDMEVEPTEVPNRKNLVIGVEEAPTGSVDLGAGFSSVDSLIGFVGLTQSNFDLFNPPYFRGGGQRFRIRATIGTSRKDYVISFVEPWFLDRRLRLETDLYFRELNYLSDLYNEQQLGARVGLVRALTRDIEVGLNYTIESIGIRDVSDSASTAIRQEAGDRLVSRVGTFVAYDTRNSVRLPNHGQRTMLESQVTGGPLGGDTQIYKFDLTSSWYFPGFFEGHILEVTGWAGTAETWGNNTRVPLFDRWFLGGANNMRGYRYHRVGPKDEASEPLGGETYWFGSLEYSIPIIERFRVAAFYDVGQVYGSSFSANPNASRGEKIYNDNYGVGIRIDIPQFGAPLRLDYGIPITHDRNTSGAGHFQFGVGYNKTF